MLTVYSGRDVEPGIKKLQAGAESALDEIRPTVQAIIDRVARDGDRALIELTAELDGVELEPRGLAVGRDEIEKAVEIISPELRQALNRAKDNITDFHKRQLRNSWFRTDSEGSISGQMFVPLDSAGLYIPGGRASYPSTLLMNAVPATVTGVERLVMVTPPGPGGDITPVVLATAAMVGVDQIYRIGGAQAVAALALGTETIKPVDKIVGPGNVYVSMAKQILFGRVGIDMIAGPSEILVLADNTADPLYIACDLISQAEHDPLARAILVTTDSSQIDRVNQALKTEIDKSPRREIVSESLDRFGSAFLVDDISTALKIVNRLAPEHLAVMTDDPWRLIGRINNAGTVFLGDSTPEALGDYLAGLNHVLPTAGTARFASGLGVDDFIKRIQVLSYSREGLESAIDDVALLAETEGLPGHARSVRVRRQKPDGDNK